MPKLAPKRLTRSLEERQKARIAHEQDMQKYMGPSTKPSDIEGGNRIFPFIIGMNEDQADEASRRWGSVTMPEGGKLIPPQKNRHFLDGHLFVEYWNSRNEIAQIAFSLTDFKVIWVRKGNATEPINSGSINWVGHEPCQLKQVGTTQEGKTSYALIPIATWAAIYPTDLPQSHAVPQTQPSPLITDRSANTKSDTSSDKTVRSANTKSDTSSDKTVHVHGYTKKDGTHVDSYDRRPPSRRK